jgi:hypothetical protein
MEIQISRQKIEICMDDYGGKSCFFRSSHPCNFIFFGGKFEFPLLQRAFEKSRMTIVDKYRKLW